MARSKRISDAYILAAFGFIGVAGLHRFYMGKYGTGILWLITGGLAGFGTFYDLLTMPRQVADANRMALLDDISDDDLDYVSQRRYESARQMQQPQSRPRPEASSLEHMALLLARENDGVLTTAALAVESGASAEKARDQLEQLVLQGLAWPGTRNDGVSVYVFQEFLTDRSRGTVLY